MEKHGKILQMKTRADKHHNLTPEERERADKQATYCQMSLFSLNLGTGL